MYAIRSYYVRVGTDTATTILGLTDGYYKDKLVKILLPEEANIILDNIKLVPGGAALVENVILGINRSAEDAAKEAGPIRITSYNVCYTKLLRPPYQWLVLTVN